MGDVVRVSTGPKSSTGSPSTLKIRPRVALPTGRLRGAPVSTTSIPLIRPSASCKLHTALRKPKDPLTAEGSATRWRTFRSRPKTPIFLEFRSDPHSHRSLLKPAKRKPGKNRIGSTKGEQNRIWQWFFGSITDSRPRHLASTPVDLSCSPPLTQPGGGLM
ncbi:hypothetical protein PIB30_079053 [Stylosanthes scabra]|uniref:Uncharacterized protein n=1 Tax=Stylosanthes scabra TaxID=79078 RepID=A0ABU6QRG1_9FABA|nr:hypothetical protein [Stylosanthes scabra]